MSGLDVQDLWSRGRFAEVGGAPEREAEVFSGRIYDLYGLIRLRIKTLLVTVLNLYEMQVIRFLC